MSMAHHISPLQSFSIPTTDGGHSLDLYPGRTVTFVGANGTGKTRLASFIEKQGKEKAHRIAAHRALNLNSNINKIALREALQSLETGISDGHGDYTALREGFRWGRKSPTHLLNDYDPLLQVLFAEQSNTTLKTHRQAHFGVSGIPTPTKFEKLEDIWNTVLPHRRLNVTGDTIKVKVPNSSSEYNASELSDGERAVLYLIGQVLAFDEPKILIFDEPELHIHRSIMDELWDRLEAERPDCSFLLITHDLEFASSRQGEKYILNSYANESWEISEVSSTYFGEEIATRILGNRKFVLFVEGNENSIDKTIYSACYPEWQVLQRGGSSAVRRAVVEMRKCSEFNRINCAGIVDADDISDDEREKMKEDRIFVLEFAEIENILAIQEVCNAIAKELKFNENESTQIIEKIHKSIFDEAKCLNSLNAAALRYVKRRIDRHVKSFDIPKENTSMEDLSELYSNYFKDIDLNEIKRSYVSAVEKAIRENDISLLLKHYDSKALLAKVAEGFGYSKKRNFESWLSRQLRNSGAGELISVIRNHLPQLPQS